MDKELLFKSRLPEDDVDVSGVGTVRVRGLNRIEAMHIQAATDPAEADRRIIAQGLVDPVLVISGLLHQLDGKPCKACAEAGQWQKASIAAELEPVTTRIAELAGIAPDAAKQAVKGFEADPDLEFQLLPGAEAVDDGLGATGPDVE